MFSLIYTKPQTNKRIEVLTHIFPDAIGIYELATSYEFSPLQIPFVNKSTYIKYDDIQSISFGTYITVIDEDGMYIAGDVDNITMGGEFQYFKITNISSSEFEIISNSNNPILECIKLYCQKTNQDINGIINGYLGNDLACTFQLID